MDSKPYQVMPPLSTEERAALKDDIRRNGVLVAIEKDEYGAVLDGHHRLELLEELRAEGERLPDPAVIIRPGLSEAEKIEHVLSLNLPRRHLTAEQRKDLATSLRQKGMSLRVIADRLGVSKDTVQRDTAGVSFETPATVTGRDGKTYPASRPSVIAKTAREERLALEALPDIPDDVLPGRPVTAFLASKVAERHRARAQLKNNVVHVAGDDLGLHTGDFREAGVLVPDCSVDLVLCDPPYQKDRIGIYGDLAAFADRVLRPGGLCLAYVGVHFLSEAMAHLGRHLGYFWTFAATHAGGGPVMRKRNIRNLWKPVLAFAKPPAKPWWGVIPDRISGGKEKDHHEWQQALAEAEYFVRHLCPEGGLVCDPFAGSGTVLLAARNLGRRVIGFEIDHATAERARRRMAEADTDADGPVRLHVEEFAAK